MDISYPYTNFCSFFWHKKKNGKPSERHKTTAFRCNIVKGITYLPTRRKSYCWVCEGVRKKGCPVYLDLPERKVGKTRNWKRMHNKKKGRVRLTSKGVLPLDSEVMYKLHSAPLNDSITTNDWSLYTLVTPSIFVFHSSPLTAISSWNPGVHQNALRRILPYNLLVSLYLANSNSHLIAPLILRLFSQHPMFLPLVAEIQPPIELFPS